MRSLSAGEPDLLDVLACAAPAPLPIGGGGRIEVTGDERGIVDDNGQQVVEVVRDTPCELPETLQTLRLVQVVLSRSRSASACRRSRSRAAVTRSLMSRIAATASGPCSVWMLERLISAGNSLPSPRRPKRSSPTPIGRVRGSSKYPVR